MGKRRKRPKKHKKDRKTRKGIDFNKVARIYRALAEAGDWNSMRQIAKLSGVNENTTRYYLVNHLDRFIDVQEVIPDLRLKLVKLKPGTSHESIIRWLRVKEKLDISL